MNKDLRLGPVLTSKFGDVNSISWLNGIILKYINSVYAPFGFSYGVHKDINVNDEIINTEYIGKMVNNYTVFKNIINKESINTEDGFYNYMIANLYDVYHYNGKYFNEVTLPILIATTRKGNIGERNSLAFFKNIFFKHNLSVNIETPTVEEDINGIDAKFKWNDRYLTIQVKPYSNFINKDGVINVHSAGSLSINIKGSNKNVDYLVFYKNKGNDIIIVRGKDVNIQGNLFIFKEDSIIE